MKTKECSHIALANHICWNKFRIWNTTTAGQLWPTGWAKLTFPLSSKMCDFHHCKYCTLLYKMPQFDTGITTFRYPSLLLGSFFQAIAANREFIHACLFPNAGFEEVHLQTMGRTNYPKRKKHWTLVWLRIVSLYCWINCCKQTFPATYPTDYQLHAS